MGAQSDSGPSTRTNTIDENPLIQPQTNPASRDSEECDSLYVKLEQTPNYLGVKTMLYDPFRSPQYVVTLTCNGKVHVTAEVNSSKPEWKLDTVFTIDRRRINSIYSIILKEHFFELPTKIEEKGSYYYKSKLTVSTACKYYTVKDNAHKLERLVDNILEAVHIPEIFGDPLRIPYISTLTQREIDSVKALLKTKEAIEEFYLSDIDEKIQKLLSQDSRLLTKEEKDSVRKVDNRIRWAY